MFERLATVLPSLFPSKSPPLVTAANQEPTYRAGSSAGPRSKGWDAPDVSANVATASASTIRARCRDAMRNDSLARAIVETKVDDVVGWGLKALSRASDEGTRVKVQALFEEWSHAADADGVLDFAGLQALVVRNMIVDGEVFVRLRARKAEDGLPVPLQLQVLPAEICPAEYSTQTASGNQVKAGIEYSAIGARVAYWLRETPPGEDDAITSSATLHRVPAAQVLHVFEPLRPGQRRGVSLLAPALVRLRELDRYCDATLLRLQMSTMFTASVKTSGTDNVLYHPLTGERISETTSDGKAMLRLSPGIFQELLPGEDLEFNDPPDPPAGFDAFVRNELRSAGAAVGVPLECFTHDWTGMNDRLARVVLNQYRRRVHRFVWSIFVPQFMRPIWNAWCAAVPASAQISLLDADRNVTFAPHAWPYVHPVQDVASTREAIRSGLTSRAAAVAETGEDVEVIDAQIAADNKRADKLQIKVDSDGRQQRRTQAGAR
ncbi:MAG: phage portal protein [Vicinamibacterales bacterium]